jgi:hypothetical protein
VGVMIFVASCAKNTQLPNNICAPIMCVPIYGRATDWDVISDDLARNIYRHNILCEKYTKGS